MRNKSKAVLLLASSIIVIYSCNAKQEKPVEVLIDKEQVKRDIQAKEDEYAANYNAGILKSIGYYADDATSFYQNRLPLVGKDAIVEFLRSDLTNNSNKISFKTNEVFVSNDGKQVVEVGYFTVVDSLNMTINTGNYMSLFEKRDDKYVCVRDMSASDIPVQY